MHTQRDLKTIFQTSKMGHKSNLQEVKLYVRKQKLDQGFYGEWKGWTTNTGRRDHRLFLFSPQQMVISRPLTGKHTLTSARLSLGSSVFNALASQGHGYRFEPHSCQLSFKQDWKCQCVRLPSELRRRHRVEKNWELLLSFRPVTNSRRQYNLRRKLRQLMNEWHQLVHTTGRQTMKRDKRVEGDKQHVSTLLCKSIIIVSGRELFLKATSISLLNLRGFLVWKTTSHISSGKISSSFLRHTRTTWHLLFISQKTWIFCLNSKPHVYA